MFTCGTTGNLRRIFSAQYVYETIDMSLPCHGTDAHNVVLKIKKKQLSRDYDGRLKPKVFPVPYELTAQRQPRSIPPPV
jgi:hypothetical protein